TTLMAMSAKLMRPGRDVKAAPAIVLGWRTCPARTHSGHWKPTAASCMQAGQIVRLHRWQRIAASRSGWRSHRDDGVASVMDEVDGLRSVFVDSHAVDDNRIDGAISGTRRDRTDVVDHRLALRIGDFPENAVPPVQPVGRHQRDEEL